MTKYFIASHIEIIANSSYALGNMGELLTRGKHYKVQRLEGVVGEDEVHAHDEDGGPVPPVWWRGGGAGVRRRPGVEDGDDAGGLGGQQPLAPSSSLEMVLV